MEASGIAHVAFGIASLALGAAVLSSTKGTTVHRALGALYVLCMFALYVTALTIYRAFGGFGVFHVLTVINLPILLAGFAAVLLKLPRGRWLRYHYYLMAWSYVGLWAATATEIAVRIPGVSFWWAVALPTMAVVLGGGACVQLLQRRTLTRYVNAQRDC